MLILPHFKSNFRSFWRCHISWKTYAFSVQGTAKFEDHPQYRNPSHLRADHGYTVQLSSPCHLDEINELTGDLSIWKCLDNSFLISTYSIAPFTLTKNNDLRNEKTWKKNINFTEPGSCAIIMSQGAAIGKDQIKGMKRNPRILKTAPPAVELNNAELLVMPHVMVTSWLSWIVLVCYNTHCTWSSILIRWMKLKTLTVYTVQTFLESQLNCCGKLEMGKMMSRNKHNTQQNDKEQNVAYGIPPAVKIQHI